MLCLTMTNYWRSTLEANGQVLYLLPPTPLCAVLYRPGQHSRLSLSTLSKMDGDARGKYSYRNAFFPRTENGRMPHPSCETRRVSFAHLRFTSPRHTNREH